MATRPPALPYRGTGGNWDDSSAFLAIGNVNGLTIHCQSSFLHRFRHGRVREDHHAQVFGTGAEFHGDSALLYQLSCTWPNHVNTQYAVGLGAGNDFDEAGSVVGRHGSTAGSEGEDADVHINAFGLQLLLVLADPGRFGMSVDNRRNQVIV